MSAMRISSALALFVLMLVPMSAFAATSTPVPSCYMKESKDYSGSKEFKIEGASASIATQVNTYLRSASMCPSACWDVAITLDLNTQGMIAIVKATSKCGALPPTADTAAAQKRGCAAGFTHPTLQMKRTGTVNKVDPVKDRCDLDAVTKSINSNLMDGPRDVALQALVQSAASNPELLKSDLGKEQTTGVLMAFGVSEEDAKKAIEERPQETQALLQALASGDQERVTAAAESAGVSLNADLSDIANISPKDLSNKFAPLYNEDQKRAADLMSNQVTGLEQQGKVAPPPGGRFGDMFKRIEDQYGNSAYAPGILAKMMKVETGGNCNSVSPTGPAGCFQYSGTTWDKWSAAINNGVPLDRSLRYDPEVSAKVTANYIATNWNKYGDLITASGMDPAAALYAIHNIGDGGGPKFIQAFATNPNALVSEVLDQNSIRFNPGLYRGGNITLAQAQQNMVARMEGSTNFAGGSIAQLGGSAFGGRVQTGWDYYAPNTPYGVSPSPFGNVFTPVSTGGPVSTGAPVSTGSTVSTGGVISTGGAVPTTGSTGTTLPSAAPVVSIIAQPTSTLMGDPVKVSWSSYGMSTAQPCQVFAGQSFLAQGNEGTRSFDTKGATSSIQFLVQCFAPNGNPVKQTASVQIR